MLGNAVAFDIPLLVQFADWDDWLSRMSNVSPSALRKRSFKCGSDLLEINRRERSSMVSGYGRCAGSAIPASA